MAAARSPVLYVIAGPNGAGKTTFAREFLPAADVVVLTVPLTPATTGLVPD